MKKITLFVLLIVALTSCDSISEKKIIGKWEYKGLIRLADVPCQKISLLNFREDYTFERISKYTPLYNDDAIKIGCLNSYYSNSITVEYYGKWRIRNGLVILEIERNNAGLNLKDLGGDIESIKLSRLTDSIMILDGDKFLRIQ